MSLSIDSSNLFNQLNQPRRSSSVNFMSDLGNGISGSNSISKNNSNKALLLGNSQAKSNESSQSPSKMLLTKGRSGVEDQATQPKYKLTSGGDNTGQRSYQSNQGNQGGGSISLMDLLKQLLKSSGSGGGGGSQQNKGAQKGSQAAPKRNQSPQAGGGQGGGQSGGPSISLKDLISLLTQSQGDSGGTRNFQSPQAGESGRGRAGGGRGRGRGKKARGGRGRGKGKGRGRKSKRSGEGQTSSLIGLLTKLLQGESNRGSKQSKQSNQGGRSKVKQDGNNNQQSLLKILKNS